MEEERSNITELLTDIQQGNELARDQLIVLLYKDLKRIAARFGARPEDTISPTVLVHDAYLRLMDQNATFRDRFHFFSTISVVMRNLIIDYARSRGAEKRGGQFKKVELDDKDFAIGKSHDLLLLGEALEVLNKVNPTQAHYLELKFFAGLTFEEIARGFNVAPSTVFKDIRSAQAWLLLRMKRATVPD